MKEMRGHGTCFVETPPCFPIKYRVPVFPMTAAIVFLNTAALCEVDVPLLLDFGPPAQAVMDGFQQCGAEAYAEQKGYGLVAEYPAAAVSKGRFPDDLASDGLHPEAGSRAFQFRIKCAPGLYAVWLWVSGNGATQDFPGNRSWSLSVNGVRLAGEEVTAATFFSDKALFRWMDDDYAREPDAWARCIKPLWNSLRIEVSPDLSGFITIECQNSILHALALFPWQDLDQGRAFAAQVEKARRSQFEKDHGRLETADSPQPVSRDLPAWSKRAAALIFEAKLDEHIVPETRPEPERALRSISLTACPGEETAFSIAVTCAGEANAASSFSAEAAPFRRSRGDRQGIPVSLHYVRYTLSRNGHHAFRWHPAAVVEGVPQTLQAGVTKQILGIVRVPGTAQPGVYTSSVTLRTANGAHTVPLSLRVWAFTLPRPDELPATLGWYYEPPSGPGYWLKWYPDEQRYTALARAEFAAMARMGCNSVQLPLPDITAFDSLNGLALDFSTLDQLAELCREYGLGTEHPNLMYLLDLGRYLVTRGIPEHSPDFKRFYKKAVVAIDEWREKHDIQLAYWPVDEPREQGVNPWNRNLKDTVAYAEQLRELRLPVTVTLLGDENDGVDYTPLLPLLDIVQVHAWKGSARSIAWCRENAGHALWYYNAGMDRLSWGCSLYKSQAQGRYQWHWRWFTMPYNPFVGYKAGVVYPGPDGPVPSLDYFRIMQGINDYRLLVLAEGLLSRAGEQGEGRWVRELLSGIVKDAPDMETLSVATGEGRSNEEEQAFTRGLDVRMRRLAEVVEALSQRLGR